MKKLYFSKKIKKDLTEQDKTLNKIIPWTYFKIIKLHKSQNYSHFKSFQKDN